MCNNVRKNEDTGPRFLLLLLPEIKFKIKKSTTWSGRKTRQVVDININ